MFQTLRCLSTATVSEDTGDGTRSGHSNFSWCAVSNSANIIPYPDWSVGLACNPWHSLLAPRHQTSNSCLCWCNLCTCIIICFGYGTDTSVIEMGTILAVPSCSRVMADCGAEVIKVEASRGDPHRKYFPGEKRDRHCGSMYEITGAGKACVTVDVKKDRAKIIAMLKEADVFVTNIREHQLQSLGLRCIFLLYFAKKIQFSKPRYYSPSLMTFYFFHITGNQSLLLGIRTSRMSYPILCMRTSQPGATAVPT